MEKKYRILIVGNLQQRILDQILFCKQLELIAEDFDFLFVIDRKKYIEILKNNSKFKFTHIPNKYQDACDFYEEKQYKEAKAAKSDRFRGTIKQNKLLYSLKLLYNRIYFETFYIFKMLLFSILEHRYLYKSVLKIISGYKPNIIIVNGDRSPGLEQAFLKVSKKKKITTLMPHFVYGDIGTPANDSSCKVLSFILKKLFPKQVLYVYGKNSLFFDPATTLSLWFFGTLSKNPWSVGNGFLDVVCVDSEKSSILYQKYGVKKEKIHVMGDMALDILYKNYLKKEELKESLLEKYNLDQSKKIIILALPQLAEHNIMSWDKHWNEIEFLISSIKKLNENILISLHPKMNREIYCYLEDKFTVNILDERLFDIICTADLFVASYSSTIYWANLCGVKGIAVDFYNLNIEMFNFLENVFVLKNKNNFIKNLEQILSASKSFESDWNELSRDKLFDGKTLQRYKEKIKRGATQSRI